LSSVFSSKEALADNNNRCLAADLESSMAVLLNGELLLEVGVLNMEG
jgi:hypothetical protein